MKVIVFSLLMYVSLAFGGTSGFPLELMEAADIRDIERLDYEVVRLSAKIKQCAARRSSILQYSGSRALKPINIFSILLPLMCPPEGAVRLDFVNVFIVWLVA